MTKLTALRPFGSVLDPAESLTDEIPEPENVGSGNRTVAELSMEQLSRIAGAFADDLIPPSAGFANNLSSRSVAAEHINPLLVELWRQGHLQDAYVDQWRSHASRCDICTSVIEAAESAAER